MQNVTVIQPKLSNQSTVFQNIGIPRRVAGYARVSTDKDEQFTSYEAQIDYYTRFIQTHDGWELVGIYTDEGLTGTSTVHRSGFNAMISDALLGKIDLIVTKSVSRFARNTVDSLVTIRKLKSVGCECYFEKENIYTFDGKGELLLTIMSSLAQEESRSISDNVTWGIRESMRRGKAYVPYKSFLGYFCDSNGNMLIDSSQAVTVRRIYCLYMSGYSVLSICKILMNSKIPSPTGRAIWYPSTVLSILSNEKYKGDALRQKTYTKDYLTKEKIKNSGQVPQYYITAHHEGIVRTEFFTAVAEQLKKRGASGDEVTLGRAPRGFKKKIICADCGGFYGEKIWHSHTRFSKTVWQCNCKYKRKNSICKTPTLTYGFILNAYKNALAEILHKNQEYEYICDNIRRKMYENNASELEKRELDYEIESIGKLDGCLRTPDGQSYSQVRMKYARERLEDIQKEAVWRENQRSEVEKRLNLLKTEGIEYADLCVDLLLYNITVSSDGGVSVNFNGNITKKYISI